MTTARKNFVSHTHSTRASEITVRLAWLAVALLWSGSLLASDQPFAPTFEIEGSWSNPQDMTVADIDGDGDLDLAATSSDDDHVAWWENTAGDGSAWSRVDLDLSFDNARGIRAGDLDGDGDLDLVAAAFGASQVRWYENDPTGTSCGSAWCSAVLGVGTSTNLLALGDLDRDGDLDVVTSLRSGGTVVWFENSAGDASSWLAHQSVSLFTELRASRPGSRWGSPSRPTRRLEVLPTAVR